MTTYECPRCAATGVGVTLGVPEGSDLADVVAEHDHWHHDQHPAEQRRAVTIAEPITFEVCSGCERVVGGPIGVAISVPFGVTVTLTGDGSGMHRACPECGGPCRLSPTGPAPHGRIVGPSDTLGYECGTADPDCERPHCPVHRP